MGAAEVIACEEIRASKGTPCATSCTSALTNGAIPERRSGTNRQQLTGTFTAAIVAHVRRGEYDRTQTTPRSTAPGVMECCGLSRSSVAPWKPWWVLCSLSGPIAIVGFIAWAAIPLTRR
jgi:hypothetical protein